MLKNHPKGVYVAFVINVGERFAFYTMMAILSLFLQAKYGLSFSTTGDYYSWFYFAVYAMALLGGLAADWMRRYKSVIMIGQILMIIGYILIALPFISLQMAILALIIIALGNGLFKGNLQVVVGHLYDDERYAKLRDSAYLFFYMGVNIGALFAPYVASEIRNWWLNLHGFAYDSNLTMLCHHLLNNTLTDTAYLQQLSQKVILNAQSYSSLTQFAESYIYVFSQGYHWAFAMAAIAMIASFFVFMVFNKNLPDRTPAQTFKQLVDSFQVKQPLKQRKVKIVSISLIILTVLVFQLIPGLNISGKLGLSLAVGIFLTFIAFIYVMASAEERPRVISLISLYAVVIVFWMTFNQSGLTLTQFAVDYTAKDVSAFTYLFFDFKSVLCILLIITGTILLIHARSTLRNRIIGGGFIFIFGALCYYFVQTSPQSNIINPEVFQSFNPIFILLLMPVVIWFFDFLREHRIEPTTHKKVAIGLIVAGIAFIVLLIGSLHVVSPYRLNGSLVPADSRVSPYWLMGTYFILTLSEIFLSPMGASFVSQVSPKRFQGLMQGGWLFTTAVGSKFLVIGSFMWDKVELSVLWGLFALCCIIAAVIVFSNLKKLGYSSNK